MIYYLHIHVIVLYDLLLPLCLKRGKGMKRRVMHVCSQLECPAVHPSVVRKCSLVWCRVCCAFTVLVPYLLFINIIQIHWNWKSCLC